MSELSGYDMWAVRSNLRTAREEGRTPAEQAELLRANGYPKWADAVAAQGVLLEEFLGGYLDGILFTERVSEDDDTSLLSHGYDRDSFSPVAVAAARSDCWAFIEANRDDLQRYCELRGDPVRCAPDSFGRSEYSAAECAGTDFWLSRNGHGAGFFDRGTDPAFDRLQGAARVYGESMFWLDGDEIREN